MMSEYNKTESHCHCSYNPTNKKAVAVLDAETLMPNFTTRATGFAADVVTSEVIAHPDLRWSLS